MWISYLLVVPISVEAVPATPQVAVQPPATDIARTYYLQGKQAVQENKTDDAIANYLAALAYGFASFAPAEQIEMLHYLGFNKKFSEASVYLEAILQANPNFPEARTLLALFLGWEKKFPEAEAHINYVLSQNPDNTDALLIKANLLQWNKRTDEAIAVFVTLLQKKKSYNAQIGLIQAYIARQDYESAEAILMQVVTENETQKKTVENYFLLVRAGKTNAIIKRAFDFVTAWSHECAEVLLWDALCADPTNDQIRLALARILGIDGLFDCAFYETCYLLCKNPYSVEARLLLADLFRWRGHFLRSIILYRQLLFEDVKNEAAKEGLGWAYVAIGKRADAWRIACNIKENRNLIWAIASRPFFDFTYRYLKDSEDLIFHRLVGRYGWVQKNCAWSLEYAKYKGADPFFNGDLDQFDAAVTFPVNIFWSLSLDGGVAYVNDRLYGTGNISARIRPPHGNIFISGAYRPYRETVEALSLRIRYYDVLVAYDYSPHYRHFFGGSYEYLKYTDANHVYFLNFFYQYLLRRRVNSYCYYFPFNPEISLKYNYTYADSHRNTGNGYFSGRDFVEHRLTLIFSIKNWKGEPIFEALPQMTYVKYFFFENFRGYFYGGIGNIYKRFCDNILIVGGVKGGQYIFFNGNKYSYYDLAVRFLYEF